MNNYYYIVAGLPVLSSKGENKNFSFQKLRDEIYDQCSKSDRLCIEFLERGFDEQNLNEAFYKEASKSPSRFIREYFSIDLSIRNLKVKNIAKRLYDPKEAEEKIATYSVSSSYNGNGNGNGNGNNSQNRNASQPEDKSLEAIFQNPNILEKEQQLDDYKWQKINELTIWDYFDRDVILSFLVKGKLVDRWQALDKKKGEELFRKLVSEVRGTFDKNKLTNKEV